MQKQTNKRNEGLPILVFHAAEKRLVLLHKPENRSALANFSDGSIKTLSGARKERKHQRVSIHAGRAALEGRSGGEGNREYLLHLP